MEKKNDVLIPLENLEPRWKKLAYEDYSFYIQYIHRGLYKPAKHIEIITNELIALEKDHLDKNKIMFTLPPRHSKSMTITETFPSWYIGKNPERLVIEVSYSGNLAKKFGQRNLEKIERFGKSIFNVEIHPKQQSSVDWGIKKHRGQMLSSGVGGSITGEGADLLLIDDPIKNRQEAYSQTYRDRLWHEYDTTLRSRLHTDGKVILITTRWHHDDLAGRILEHEGDEWKKINMPAICEKPENDILDRKRGEALWPEKFPKKILEKRKNNMDRKAWESLYQGNPSPEEGDIIKSKWWNYYNRIPRINKFNKIIMSWDCAFKDQKDSSFVVGQVWGLMGTNAYLLDQSRSQLDFSKTVKEIKNMEKKWPEAKPIYIEDKANGPAVINVLNSQISGLKPVSVKGGKVSRAYAVTPFLEAGNVYIPNPSKQSWVSGFIDECSRFPEGDYDDQVDSMTQALEKLFNNRNLRPSTKKPRGF